MADGTRLDPRLERELALVASAGQIDRPIPVVIELAVRATAPGGLDRRAKLDAMERQSLESQAGVAACLAELGAREVQRAGLVNAIGAELTSAGVRLIAGHPDVRMVRLARPEDVTAAL